MSLCEAEKWHCVFPWHAFWSCKLLASSGPELVSRQMNPPQNFTNFRLGLTKNDLCFLVSLVHGWHHRADSLWLIQWLQAQPPGKTKPASLVSLHHQVPKLPFPHWEKAFYLKELLWGLESRNSCEAFVPAKEMWVTIWVSNRIGLSCE